MINCSMIASPLSMASLEWVSYQFSIGLCLEYEGIRSPWASSFAPFLPNKSNKTPREDDSEREPINGADDFGWLPQIQEEKITRKSTHFPGHYPEGFQQRTCCAWKLSLLGNFKILYFATLPETNSYSLSLKIPMVGSDEISVWGAATFSGANQPHGWTTWWYSSNILFDGRNHRFSGRNPKRR